MALSGELQEDGNGEEALIVRWEHPEDFGEMRILREEKGSVAPKGRRITMRESQKSIQG